MSLKHLLTISMLLIAPPGALADARPSTAGPGVHVLSPALTMPGLDRSRTIRVYLPPSYAGSHRRYPVLYMHDAQNLFDDATSFIGEWGVDEAMDALARSRGIEVIVVGIDNGQDKRIKELSPWTNKEYGAAEGRQYMHFLVGTVKPFIDRKYRTRPGVDDTGIMGSSLGGLTSHFAIHEYPNVFGKAGILSPSYWFSSEVYQHSKSHPLRPGARIYLVCGGAEGGQTASNLLRMDRQLRAARVRGLSIHTSIRVGAEHNEKFWKTEFPQAMVYLFGPKQASVPPDDQR